MSPEAFLSVRLVKTDEHSKNKSMNALKEIEEVKRATLTYGRRVTIIAEIEYKGFDQLVNTVDRISKLENVWIHDVHKKETEYQKEEG